MANFIQIPGEYKKPKSGIGESLGMIGRTGVGLLERYAQEKKQKETQSNLAELLSDDTHPDRIAKLLPTLSVEQQFKYKELTNKQKELYNKPAPGGPTNQSVPPGIQNKISQIVKENPDASPEELAIKFGEAEIPQINSNPYVESRRRTFEYGQKNLSEKEKEDRSQTGKLKIKIAERAEASMQGIESKEQLQEVIDRKNLNDPTFVAVMDLIPGKFGQRFLSPDSVQYRGSLVDEYKDLKIIFTGATRTAELGILGKKVPDLYLTDDQKTAILKSRMKALEYNLVELDAAEEVEKEFPNAGVLKFQKELNKKIKKQKQTILDGFLDENNRIIAEAESFKNIVLDDENPVHVQILDQILLEANMDNDKAREIAKERGYRL